MGLFADNVVARVPNQNKWMLVKKALEDQNDGSYEEFLEVLHNPFVSAMSISNALKKTIGIHISDRSISRWRREGYGRI